MKKILVLFVAMLLSILPVSADTGNIDEVSRSGPITREEALQEIPENMFDALSDDLINLYVAGRMSPKTGDPSSIFSEYLSYWDSFESFLNAEKLKNAIQSRTFTNHENGIGFFILDFKGIEHFKNLKELYLVIDQHKDMDFEALKNLQDPGLGEKLTIKYHALPLFNMMSGGKTYTYREAEEANFITNYRSLVDVLATLDFGPERSVYLSETESMLRGAIFKYYKEYKEITNPYNISKPESEGKTLKINVPYDTTLITQTYDLKKTPEGLYHIHYELPFELDEYLDESDPFYEPVYVSMQRPAEKIIIDGQEIPLNEGGSSSYIGKAFKTLDIFMRPDYYDTYYTEYIDFLEGLITHPGEYRVSMHHQALVEIVGFPSAYDQSGPRISLIERNRIIDISYLLNNPNNDENIRIEGDEPEDLKYVQKDQYSGGSYYHYTEDVTQENVPVFNLKLAKPGYKFVGWFDRYTGQPWDFSTLVDDNTFVEALWIPEEEVVNNYVDVTFHPENGEANSVETIRKGYPVDEPIVPTLDRHRFLGWSKTENAMDAWNFDDAIHQNLDLYAQWIETFRVDFEVNGGSEVTPLEAVDKDAKILEPNTARDGYTFEGWYKDADLTQVWNFASDTVTSDITLYAKWEAIPVATYTVNFVTNGGSPVDALTGLPSGSTITSPTTVRDGYTFVGWYKDADLTQAWNFASDTVTSDITLYAKWEAIPVATYTVNFVTNGGTPVDALTGLPSGSTITSPTTVRDGYTFADWYKDADLTQVWNFASDTVTSDITLYAKWEAIPVATYTVNFVTNGGSPVDALTGLPSGSTITSPTTVRDGYTFAGWYQDADLTQVWNFASDTVTSDITLYAKWDEKIVIPEVTPPSEGEEEPKQETLPQAGVGPSQAGLFLASGMGMLGAAHILKRKKSRNSN